MLKKLFYVPLLTFFVPIIALSQADEPPRLLEPTVIVSSTPSSEPYPLSVTDYLAKAAQRQGTEQQKFLLLAAGKLISHNQWQQGLRLLTQLSPSDATQVAEKELLLAKINLLKDNPQATLTQLTRIKHRDRLSSMQQIQFHELAAQAYQRSGKKMMSVAERIHLETLLHDEAALVSNRRSLWLALLHMSTKELQTMATETPAQSELHGWLQLALISRQYRFNTASLLSALDTWQAHFSTHPANHMLPKPLDSVTHKMLTQHQKVALLLPLSGPFAGPGHAIHDGFVAAQKKNPQEQIQVRLYDTNHHDVIALYEQAIQDGAQYVVGPLLKNQVTIVAALPHPVPTLLLNDSSVEVQDNSYVFGLSPSDEAKQVAVRAHQEGHTRALVIAPDNTWGDEVRHAFDTQWSREGGTIVETMTYSPRDDLNKKMRDFLQISDSELRTKNIKTLLGYAIDAEPNRRQDFDMIFLLAYPSKARQMMPILKYYYTGDIPVYATSSVYGAQINALKDKDLEGLMFCDIPWVFSHQTGAKNWPETLNSYNRLFAIGMDSFALASELNQLILFPADVHQDSALYLNATQRVARVLEWGQFKQGLVHSLGKATV